MNIKHGGNISKETADLIKQLEQSGGGVYTYIDLASNFTLQGGEFPLLFADSNIVNSLPESDQDVPAKELTAMIAQSLVDIQNSGVHFYAQVGGDGPIIPVTLSIADDPEDPEYDGSLVARASDRQGVWKASEGGAFYMAFCVSDQTFFRVGWTSHIPE